MSPAPVHVDGELLATRRQGAFVHLTLAAPGVPERFRAGTFLAVSVADARLARRALWIHRVRETSAFGPTIDVVVAAAGPGTGWLATRPVGTRLALTGPLGRPFALPREPASCLLVGEEHSAAPLFPLAERLRERSCPVTLLLGARDEAHLLSAREARRAARAVTVTTADGSVGLRGGLADHVADVVGGTGPDVVYGVGTVPAMRAVATAAEQHGSWCQVALEVPTPCGTGLCQGCPVPVVGEDGVARVVRACTEGPVLRGDRVDWPALAGEAR